MTATHHGVERDTVTACTEYPSIPGAFSPIIISQDSDVLVLNTTTIDVTDSNSGDEENEDLYSQSISSLLLNLSGFNTQSLRRNNLPDTRISVDRREVVITEFTDPNTSYVQTSTIKHVLECKRNTHRVIARLVDVFPKELSKINLEDNNSITLVLNDESGYSLNAEITAPVDKQTFFDFFVSDATSQETKLIQIGALFEFITGKIGLFNDYVIYEEAILEDQFLLDLHILEKDNSFQIVNTRFKNVFMVSFCSHLLENNEDILTGK